MFNLFNKKKNKTKSNLFSFVFLKRRINPKKLLIISIFALIIVTISIFSAYSFPGSSGGVVIDDNYVVVAFTDVGSHTWTVPTGVTEVDVLVVGGGGSGGGRTNSSGGWHSGGGGGGGGIVFESNYDISNLSSISIVVGSGGIPTPRNSSPNSDPSRSGENSSFNNLIAIGGGAGGDSGSSSACLNGLNGGGGGGAGTCGSIRSGGSGTINQGNDGGSGRDTSGLTGDNIAGGGGTGSSGNTPGGAGGDGGYYGDIFGNNYGENGYFSGGGAGGSGTTPNYALGGAGGGGNGGGDADGEDALVNTGGGGGGGSRNYHIGGSGGSGIVLIRYKVDSKLQVSSLNSGLVGHWTLDQDKYNPNISRVTDNTPYSNHGTNHGATFTTNRFGKEGGAMEFNGNNYIRVPGSDSLNEVSKKLTISGWFHRDFLFNERVTLFSLGTAAARQIVFRSNSGSIHLDIAERIDGIDWNYPGRLLSYPPEEWFSLIITINDTEVKGFLNGIHVGTRTLANDFSLMPNGFTVRIGEQIGFSRNWQGKIDDFRIYNRILSSQEINQLYNSYQPKITPSLQRGLILDMPLTSTYTKSSTPGSEIITDRTPYSNDGQNFGATITGEGAEFDGSNNFIEINHDKSLNPGYITISLWLKHNEMLGQYPRFLDKGGFSRSASYDVGLRGADLFYVNFYDVDSTRFAVYNSNVVVPQNEWSFWAVTYDEDKIKLYKNGELAYSVNSGKELSDENVPLILGNDYESYNYGYKGKLSNVRIYNRSLSAEEVQLLYSRGR